MLIDTHAHLNHHAYKDDLADVIENMGKVGVERVINVGFDLPSSRRAVELAQEYPQFYGAVGIHPHDAVKASPQALETIARLAQRDKVVAIGETGLDYYYEHSPREVQQEAFRAHIRLAKDLGMPIIIHSRDAAQDTLTILREEGVGPGVMHCYSGSAEMARDYMDLGLYISFAGPITFNNARKLQETAKGLPLDRLLVETDAPYLTPTPHRGRRNEPAYVSYVAEQLARLQNRTYEEVAQITTANARALFGIA
ncbi:MAG: TatD family hydrolase [Limnochordia bacterium]|jgi:TatD DNase family protein